MSNPNAPSGFGGTLTNGIQDIAGLLPVIGTEKCEEHIGSALQGGYLYAAATPLSIFGSLGIIKAGISILVASVSIHKPTRFFESSGRWLGARVLNNAGFKLPGNVAPLIGMDKRRYKAESRLIDMLEAKHIDNPEKLSIEWKSREWNLGLLVSTMLAAALGFTPYIKLTALQPSTVHSPWMFPLLRIMGSCIASVCCQILIQHRVISIMKNRVIFMVINRLHSDELNKLDIISGQSESRDALPAEECLEQLEQHLRAHVPRQSTEADDAEKQLHQQDVPPAETTRENTPLKTEPDPIPPSGNEIPSLRKTLHEQRKKHFPTSPIEHLVFLVSWILLLLSLPAAVAGYIGCFTVVSSSTTDSKDPLIWLGIEAALSVIRVLLWASDPKFDEKTDVTVKLTLTEQEPLVTTEKDTYAIKLDGNILPLVPERKFLEWITPYTGPLEQFKTLENIGLYFTLSGRLEGGQKRLFMTVLELHKRMAFTLRQSKNGQLEYVAASVTCDTISVEMQAELQSTITNDHPWQKNHSTLFGALSDYYRSLLCQLKRANPGMPDHQMTLQWNLEEKRSDTHRIFAPNAAEPIPIPPLTQHDELYLQRGHEHQLKSMLVDNWGRWIVDGMAAIRTEARNSCHYHLANPNSDEAKWELTELDTQLVWEWSRREQNLLHLTVKLEDILRLKMDNCIESVGERQLGEWMSLEFVLGQRKRLEKEWKQSKARMEQASVECIKEQDEDDWGVEGKWKAAKAFINQGWEKAIAGRTSSLKSSSALEDLANEHRPKSWKLRGEKKRRLSFVDGLESRFSSWNVQRNSERRDMEDTVARVAAKADDEQLESTYKYPESRTELATTIHSRFPYLGSLSQDERVFAVKQNSVGMVYATHYCNDADIVRTVVQKESARCVRLVPPNLIDVIPEKNNLLYLSTDSDNNRELVLPFIQRNRDRWWHQQQDNSFTFYFSPGYARTGQQYIATYGGPIAHIMVHIKTPTYLRLRLLHCRDRNSSVSIQKQGVEQPLHSIRADDIPEYPKSRLHDIDLDQFQPGNYELDVVANSSGSGSYLLRDILIDFHNDAPLDNNGHGELEQVGPGSTAEANTSD